MDVFRICGGNPLSGSVRIGSAKNAVLPILAAAMLTDGAVTVRECPELVDVGNMLAILQMLGCSTQRRGGDVLVDAGAAHSWDMPDELSKKIRSSIFMLGPLIGRFRRACVTYPGGCDIGLRPIDLHLKGLRALGVKIREEHGRIYCDGEGLRGGEVYLDLPSVGATENVMMASVLAEGKTHIYNAAREPEIADLERFINAMGGKVRGAGTDVITVEGVTRLSGAEFTPVADRIVAGTLMAACAAARGEITLTNAPCADLVSPIAKLRDAGCEVETEGNALLMRTRGKLKPIDISTQCYPGFPTDLQAQFMALMCTIDGAGMVVENLFESRFGHAAQLMRMGADIYVRGRLAVVRGGRLTGAKVTACDLRGGAALVIAGLAAEGVTEVCGCGMIDRGYERFEDMLGCLGGDIVRISGTED